ncbi:MAG: TonB-dependent receptor [Thermoguttaceae bacterium]|jgi:iron complex outermembrane receptor protein
MKGGPIQPPGWLKCGILLVLLLRSPGPVRAQSEAAAATDRPAEQTAAGQAGGVVGGSAKDILDLDIDQLSKVDVKVPAMDVPITSVTREPSTIGHSAAAVFVITPEMIRRSGATNVPECLRMVPGLDVAHIDGNKWAISSRGFNGRFGNKLLVMIDGRAVYTPLFSGVYWEVQNVMLEDIQRIEVIRGPGATVWGSNAVNGVINIITKQAQSTQGVLASGGGGSYERDFGAFRYGGRTGEGVYYRAYGMYFDRAADSFPADSHDGCQLGQGGFRVDWDVDRLNTDKITLQGDYYDGHVQSTTVEPVFPDPSGAFQQSVQKNIPVTGGNLVARWTHTIDEESSYSWQIYYDRLDRADPALLISQDAYDIDFTHHFLLNDRQQITWGGGYRLVRDDVVNSDWLALFPPGRQINLFSAFLQDEITLVEDHLVFTPGCKLERNDFTGFECQPSARVLWMFDKRSSAWGAISRAVRTPSIAEEDACIVSLPIFPHVPVFPVFFGNPNLKSEAMVAYELGYRVQATDHFSWDVALFFNQYDNLRTVDPTLVPGLPPYFIPFMAQNDMWGNTYGLEWSCQWEIAKSWRLRGYYALLEMQLHARGAAVPGSELDEGASPANQVYLMSSWDLGANVDFDMMLRYVDSLPALGVPSYIEMDLRLAWRPRKHLELAVVGQNLLENHLVQFSGTQFVPDQPAAVPRGVYGKVTWRY